MKTKGQGIENKRMQSIARRVSLSFLMRTLFILLLVNAILVVVFLGITGYSIEKTALGDSWTPNLTRTLIKDDGASGMDWVLRLRYQYALAGSEEQFIAPIGETIVTLSKILNSLILAQVILVYFHYRGFRKRTLYLLEPLRIMTQTAQQLSQEQFDEQRYHNLEDAIDKLSVQSPSAKLQTGNTELSSLENAINNLVARMHEAYRLQTRFVSDASHELRTPIAVIRGYADLLSRWGKDDRKVMDESVSAIKDEADNMQRLVEQLLFLARGDAGRTMYTPGRVDLSELLKEAYEEYTLINQGHVFRLRTEDNIIALGDESMLKQALRILVDNAVKFSPPGSAITLRAFISEGGLACFSVTDNGMGIKPEDLKHIFDRFYRSDPARQKGGTGLGLSIAKWIAERHAGHIDVFSSPGLGTRFTVNLPAFSQDQLASQKEASTDTKEQAKKQAL